MGGERGEEKRNSSRRSLRPFLKAMVGRCGKVKLSQDNQHVSAANTTDSNRAWTVGSLLELTAMQNRTGGRGQFRGWGKAGVVIGEGRRQLVVCRGGRSKERRGAFEGRFWRKRLGKGTKRDLLESQAGRL